MAQQKWGRKLRKEFSYAKLVKFSSLAYCALTVLFFLFLNIAAGFVAQVQESGGTFSGAQQACILVVNILIYVELFGYFAILWMVFMYFFKKNQYSRMHRQWPATEKFPLWFFLAGMVFFLIFMSLMKMMLA